MSTHHLETARDGSVAEAVLGQPRDTGVESPVRSLPRRGRHAAIEPDDDYFENVLSQHDVAGQQPQYAEPDGDEFSGEVSRLDSAEARAKLAEAEKSLGRTASRGALVTLGGQWSRALVQTFSTVVLARLLAPEDFGLVSLVTVLLGIADLLRDFGLTSAIVQMKTIPNRMWSSFQWVSVGLGAVCMMVVAACAPLMVILFNDHRLLGITLAAAPSLFLSGISMPMQVRLQRDLRFGVLAQIDVVSMIAGVCSSIAGAALGWGYWSLLLMPGIAVVYRFIALWVVVRPPWGRPHVDRDVYPILGKGMSFFGVQAINYAWRNLDNVIVGKWGGATALGFYTRAYALLLLPLSQLNSPLARVALPVLSRLRDDHDRFRKYLRSGLLLIGYSAVPIFSIAAAVSHPLIALLLGSKWDPSATIFSLLCIAGVAQAFGNLQGWLYISLGRAKEQLFYFVIAKPIVIVGFYVGFQIGGTNGLALAAGIMSWAELIPGYYMAMRGTAVTWSDVMNPTYRPLMVAPLMFGAAWGASHSTSFPAIVNLFLGGLAGLVPLALAFLIPAYRQDLRQLLAFVQQVRGGKSK